MSHLFAVALGAIVAPTPALPRALSGPPWMPNAVDSAIMGGRDHSTIFYALTPKRAERLNAMRIRGQRIRDSRHTTNPDGRSRAW